MIKEEAETGATLGVGDTMEDVHGAIERALRARSEYVVQESATMTLQKIRRLLEKDLNVEQGFLDSYKEFIGGLINKLLLGAEAENPETYETEVEREKAKEPEVHDFAANEEEKPKMKRLKKKSDSEEVKDEVMKPQVSDAGVPSTEEGVKIPEVDSPSDSKEEGLESLIAEAIRKRAPYFKSQAESLTLQGVRRLLEQDLAMEKGALDAHKPHIAMVLDRVLNAEDEEPAPVTNAKKRKAAATESKKKSSKSGKKQKAASSEDLVEKASSEGERTSKVRNGGSRKSTKKKAVQEEGEDASGGGDDNDEVPSKEDSSGVEDSDDGETERKKVSKPKKMVESKPVYGRKVEHLKSILKACSITVPPSAYRKAKQASEERREGVLIKELEAILSKEGLTASASKDDIKAVRKRKEKLKDLEGIDTSNIIGESRGRRSRTSANSFFAPQRSEPVRLGDEDGDEEDEDDEEEQESDSEEDPNVELQDDDEED